MAQHWPFFASLLSMQGMVFSKADADLSEYYDERLVPSSLQSIGDELRTLLLQDTQTLEAVHEVGELSPQEAWGQESIRLRNVYTDPLNFLQVESLSRQRASGDERYNEAVMVTIAGIAAGMRNTG
jgi:phosphoenolpyruvate carboxylase